MTAVPAAIIAGAAPPLRWRAIALPICASCALLLLYRGTVFAMADTWVHSETFAHGAVIAPICLWLVWRQRTSLAKLPCAPSYASLLILPLLGLIWMLAALVQVQVLAQYMVVAMLAGLVVVLFGWPCARALAFPLSYLLLAVPSGEVLIAPLIDFTASFVVAALQMTGVPVYREGSLLVLSNGSWTVAEACSGLRYLIATVALGALYAHLMYRCAGRRAAFMVISVVLPLLANGVRAYLIVMIGYWTDMRLATGVDHVIYGWLFFSLVLGTLFWIGMRWREDLPAPAAGPSAPPAPIPYGLGVVCIAISAVWPSAAAQLMVARPVRAAPAALALPGLPPPMAPQPVALHFSGADLALARTYSPSISLQVGVYLQPRADASVVANGGAQLAPAWKLITSGTRELALADGVLRVREELIATAGQRLLIWRWYRQSGVDTNSRLQVKLLQAAHMLARGRVDGAEIIVASAVGEQSDTAAAALRAFLVQAHPFISSGVDHASDN
ncbi:MAG: exosortase A [Pseudomonadota bacterium]